MVHSTKYRPERRSKGQAKRNALMLFGVPRGGKMEPKERRQDLALVLRLSQQDRFRALANMALSPIHETTAFTTLMEKLQISYHDLSQEFKALQTSLGFIRAAEHLPDLMAQTALDAKHRIEKCRTCAGKKLIAVYDYEAIDKAKATVGEDIRLERPSDPRLVLLSEGKATCPKCSGTGSVEVKGDYDKLKTIFETFGLTGKGGGLAVNLDLRNVRQPETMGELSRAVAPILEGTPSTSTVPPESESEP